MNFDEIRNSIEQDLISKGFEKNGDELIKVNVKHQQIVINGQTSVQEHKQELKFVCLGEGAIDNQASVGFGLYVDDHNVTDIWCTSLEDFNYLLNRL